MTQQQFDALTKLLRLRAGPTLDAVRLHLVDGMPVPDAARAADVDYQLALKAVYRAKRGLALAISAMT
ncbi:hypothetical protein [Limnohabitans sp.]|uniref:hypothetical protein n=1 Tax=Limnohabitans sp. TaxID=1907725 RepID=UPI00286EDB72|nr:hypothetical protein [Limnohabitans sp.]